MTNEQMLSQMSKEEAVFRASTHGGYCCFKCVWWREDEHHHWYCKSPEWEAECRKAFDKWLQKEAK